MPALQAGTPGLVQSTATSIAEPVGYVLGGAHSVPPVLPEAIPAPPTIEADKPEVELFDLDDLARAHRLRAWLFNQYSHAVGRRSVEIGPGLGTFSEQLLAVGAEQLLLVEPEPAFVSALERRFDGDSRVTIAGETLPEAPSLSNGSGSWDFVLCQNVLEHVEDDAAAVRSMAGALRPGGRLTLLVPSHPRLYGSLDRSFGHHRRYTAARVREMIERAGLELQELYPFNLLGTLGWWVKNRLRARSLGSGSLRAYETLLPLWRPIEQRLSPRWGLSLVAHARR
jgi:SAM-dependent methyltransferase